MKHCSSRQSCGGQRKLEKKQTTIGKVLVPIENVRTLYTFVYILLLYLMFVYISIYYIVFVLICTHTHRQTHTHTHIWSHIRVFVPIFVNTHMTWIIQWMMSLILDDTSNSLSITFSKWWLKWLGAIWDHRKVKGHFPKALIFLFKQWTAFLTLTFLA